MPRKKYVDCFQIQNVPPDIAFPLSFHVNKTNICYIFSNFCGIDPWRRKFPSRSELIGQQLRSRNAAVGGDSVVFLDAFSRMVFAKKAELILRSHHVGLTVNMKNRMGKPLFLSALWAVGILCYFSISRLVSWTGELCQQWQQTFTPTPFSNNSISNVINVT